MISMFANCSSLSELNIRVKLDACIPDFLNTMKSLDNLSIFKLEAEGQNLSLLKELPKILR